MCMFCRSLVVCACFVDRCFSCCPFSFDHCVVCSSIYGLWLPFWYLQTLLNWNWGLSHLTFIKKGYAKCITIQNGKHKIIQNAIRIYYSEVSIWVIWWRSCVSNIIFISLGSPLHLVIESCANLSFHLLSASVPFTIKRK